MIFSSYLRTSATSADRLPAERSAARLALVLVAEVVALALFQAPDERFLRYIGFDSAVDLTMQDLLRRGYRPTIDFGCVYGLLPLLINRIWYGLAGLRPGAFHAEVVATACLTAWGIARFASIRRVGPPGVALIALAMPDVLFPSFSTFVHVLEPALLVHGLAEQARGRRGNALALATAACFVKPSMGYVYGLCLLIAIAIDARGEGWAYWRRALGPATATGMVLSGLLALIYGPGPLARTLLPGTGAAIYRFEHYGFFFGAGRSFWILPGVGPLGYFRYEVGFWLIGSAWLAWGGISGLARLARGRSEGESARDDEMIATCAALHWIFVTCFFGHRTTWTYYFAILILGLAAMAKGSRGRLAFAWVLAALLLVNDRSKLAQTARDWSAATPGKTTLRLWATPAEHAEWRRVLELTREARPLVLLTATEGSAPLVRPFGFEPPVAAYFCPGLTLPAEVRRKADQLSEASMIVTIVPRDWRGFTLWPELTEALDGCAPAFEGHAFRVYRRFRPPRRSGRGVGPESGPDRL